MGRINKLRKMKLARWLKWRNGRKQSKTTITFYYGRAPLVWHGGGVGTSGRVMFEGKVVGFGTVKKKPKREKFFFENKPHHPDAVISYYPKNGAQIK